MCITDEDRLWMEPDTEEEPDVPEQEVGQNPGRKVGQIIRPKKRKADSLDTEQSHKKRFWQFLDGTYGGTQREMEDVKDYIDIIGVEEFKKVCSYQKQKTSKAVNVQKRLLEIEGIKVTESEYLDICNDFKVRMDQKEQQLIEGERMFERMALREEAGLAKLHHTLTENKRLEKENDEYREKVEVTAEFIEDRIHDMEELEKDNEMYKLRVHRLELQMGAMMSQFFKDFERKSISPKEWFDLPNGTHFMYHSGYERTE